MKSHFVFSHATDNYFGLLWTWNLNQHSSKHRIKPLLLVVNIVILEETTQKNTIALFHPVFFSIFFLVGDPNVDSSVLSVWPT